MENVKVINLAKEGVLLPPHADVCQCCAAKHEPDEPHNQQSMFWQYWFYGRNDRWPTWADAMAHCSTPMQEAWKAELRQRGIEVGEVQS